MGIKIGKGGSGCALIQPNFDDVMLSLGCMCVTGYFRIISIFPLCGEFVLWIYLGRKQ